MNWERLRSVLSNKLYLLLGALLLVNLAALQQKGGLWKQRDQGECSPPAQIEFSPTGDIFLTPERSVSLSARTSTGGAVGKWKTGEPASWYTVNLTRTGSNQATLEFFPTNNLAEQAQGEKHHLRISYG